MKKLLVICLLLTIASLCNAQMKFNRVTPISLDTNSTQFKNWPKKQIKKLHEVKQKKVPGLDFVAVRNELVEKQKTDSNFHPIAKGINVNIDVIKDGDWESVTDYGRICRLKINVENSSALVLKFSKFHIPEGASLLIYDKKGEVVLGPLTSELNTESRKFTTGVIQGPELVFEYYQDNSNNSKPEITLDKIGVVFQCQYDDSMKVESKKDGILVATPTKLMAVPYYIISDYLDKVRPEGTCASCKVNSEWDPIDKLTKSSCVLYYWEGSWYSSVHATLVKGKDCTPYIVTASHVTSTSNDYANGSIVRFNWIRNAPPTKGDYNVCRFSNVTVPDENPTEAQIRYYQDYWKSTLDISKVVDYNGTDLLAFRPGGKDISFFGLKKHLIHNAWMCGWSTKSTLPSGKTEGEKYVSLSNYGGLPMIYSDGNISSNGAAYFTIASWANPLFAKPGYSGTPVYSPIYDGNNILEYLYIGPLINLDYNVAGFGSSSSNLSLYLPTPVNGIVNGAKYLDSCSAGTSNCCEFYYARPNYEPGRSSFTITNNKCEETIVLEERLFDGYDPSKYTCDDYVVKIFKDNGAQMSFYKLTGYLNGDETKPQYSATYSDCDTISFSDFSSWNPVYKIEESLSSGVTSYTTNYIVKFYKLGEASPLCQKSFCLNCNQYCECLATRYNITLENDTTGGKCCYKAKIVNINAVGTCSAKFIQVVPFHYTGMYPWGVAFGDSYRLTDSYWFSPYGLQLGDTAIIENICIENPWENTLEFRFQSEPMLDSLYPTIACENYCRQTKPLEACDCCDRFNIYPGNNNNPCNGLTYNVQEFSSPGYCSFNNVEVKAYIEDKYGNPYFIETIDPSYCSFNPTTNQITISKLFTFSSNSDSFSKIRFKIILKNGSNIVCNGKWVDATSCSKICDHDSSNFDIILGGDDLDPCLWNLSVNTSGLYSFVSLYKCKELGADTSDWNSSRTGHSLLLNDTINDLGPGVYRIEFGSIGSGCFYYFVLECKNCQARNDTIAIEKSANCCYKIKTNFSSTCAKIYNYTDFNKSNGCLLTRTSSNGYYYYSSSSCNDLLCNDGSTEKKIRLTIVKSGSDTCERVFTLPPCDNLSTCCGKAEVEVLSDPGNDGSSTCCFKFNIKNVGCPIDSVEIYEGTTKLKTYQTKGIDLSNLSGNSNWLCFNDIKDTTHIVTVKMYSSGSYCTINLSDTLVGCHVNEKLNCDKITGITLTKSSTGCGTCPAGQECYKLTFEYPAALENNTANIRILCGSSELAFKENQIITSEANNGICTTYVCLDMSKLPPTSESVDYKARVEFYINNGSDDDTYCYHDDKTIPIFTEIPPDPCTPSGDAAGWYGPKTGHIKIHCPSGGTDCNVYFSFFYKVETSGGNIIHRDVQVTQYRSDPGCDCDSVKITEMLKAIWNDDTYNGVQQVFNLGNVDTNEVCFSDFRVITVDCWRLTDPLLQLWSKCVGFECCMSQYQVCYKKKDGKIKVTKYNRLSNSPTYGGCPSGCWGIGCSLWSPGSYIDPESNPAIISPVGTEDITTVTPDSKTDIEITRYRDALNILVKGDEKGFVTIQLYDMLGRNLSTNKLNKFSREFRTTVNSDLQTGLYFCKVSLNDHVFSYEKILIIK